MKKIVGMLLVICIASGVHAQLLWRISGNGLEKPSYIFGTHHLASYSMLDSVPGWRPAFKETTQVIGEIVMSDMQSPATMELMQSKMLMENKTLQTLLSPTQYNKLYTLVRESMNMDLNVMPNLKPAAISNMLSMMLYMKHMPKYRPQEQLDGFFQSAGASQGKTVKALETIEAQSDLLFNSATLERQAELLICMLSDMDKMSETIERTTRAYMKQDLKAMYDISNETDTTHTHCNPLPEEKEAILDDRNLRWAEELPEMMKAQPSFIAVGALHLPGEKGILNLLRVKGFGVEGVK